jgi:RNA polymerase sigma factor (sigma-70 family)
MTRFDLIDIAEEDAPTEELLTQLYPHVTALAKQVVPGAKIADLDLDSDDLVQSTLIKLWLMSNHKPIENPGAYLKTIIRRQAIDMVRQRKPTVSLSMDEEGELSQVDVLLPSGEDVGDPALEYERKELLEEVLDAVVQLPPMQMRAMIAALKDEVGDGFPLAEEFAKRGIDIQPIGWPEDRFERQRLLSSLSVARRKLRRFMEIKQPEHDGVERAPAVQRHEAPPAGGDEPPALDQRNGAREGVGMEAPIDQLREPYRTAVRLHYAERHTYPQVANELHLPLGTAKSYISRGMKMLRRLREMGPGLHEAPEQETDIAGIVARVETLHEPYRTPVKLHYVQKRTYPQIARQLNLPKGTVKSYISRGMKMLRQSA